MLSFLYIALYLALPFAQAKSHSFKRTCSAGRSSNASKSPRVATGWYAGWHSSDFTLDDVSWNKYTHLTYSFATTTPDAHTLSLDGSDAQLLPQFVQTAHKNGVKARVAIGGWTGSQYFSTNVKTATNRTAFVKTVTDFAKQHDLDGIDFDWEYPAVLGLECNKLDPEDTANFLSFLQELRADPIGKKLILSAATSLNPWAGPDGKPLADVSGFAKTLDWIEIMNYDVWGPWSSAVGPNAPLDDTCATNKSEKAGSAVSAVAAWTAAGMPANQTVLGVAAYGHSFYVNKADALPKKGAHALAAYPPFVADKQPAGDKWDDPAGGDDGCGNITTAPGGDITFWGLIDAGYLNTNGTVASGIDYSFDSCSQTPYVYNEQTNVMVSFDDAHSFAAKGQYIQKQNLRGFSMWEVGGDSGDILLDSIRTAAGFSTK
ncbi:chitinase [Pilatotrama ljubarskyi]|nr:chitinase [Pilatotrama ljubarskyi]